MVSAELVNVREAPAYRDALNVGSFAGVAMLCRQMNDLPRVDSWQGQSQQWLAEGIRLNFAYRESLVVRRELDSIFAEVIDEAIAETDAIRRLYELAAIVANPDWATWNRRQSLGELRIALRADCLPGAVPMRHLIRGR